MIRTLANTKQQNGPNPADTNRGSRVMAILNCTPDSFSDGGAFDSTSSAVDHALRMIEDGADIIDIGGESSRPGAATVATSEEIHRVIPVIKALRKQTNIPISIDTVKATVAEQALDAGASLVNDISALRSDPRMATVVQKAQASLVLMHMQGHPKTMQHKPSYTNIIDEVKNFLLERASFAIEAGISKNKIILDPGIGFGKTLDHNIALLGDKTLATLGHRLLVGCSRKSMIGNILKQPDPKKRLAGSLACAAAALAQGASYLRVHDIKETVDFIRVYEHIIGLAKPEGCHVE